MDKAGVDLNQIPKLRSVQIRLLDALKDICDRNHLRYWIDFGTLLGAVRDGNFIPWDDDIDVSLPLDDYRRFLILAERELPRDIFLQTNRTDPGYKQYFAKLRDCHSTFLEHHESGLEAYHHGIYIDIFPSVPYPIMPRFIRKVLIYATLKTRENAFVLAKKTFFNFPAYIICKLIWLLFSPLKTAGLGQTPEDNGYKYVMPLPFIFPLGSIKFAGKNYSAPNKPAEYLAVMYGNDFLRTPPPEKRISHARKILPDTPCDHPRAIQKNDF